MSAKGLLSSFDVELGKAFASFSASSSESLTNNSLSASHNATRIVLIKFLSNVGNAAMASRSLVSQLRLSCNI